MKFVTPFILFASVCAASNPMSAQTDAYIKLHDSNGRHPRVSSVSFPGNSDWQAAYDAIYGHGAVIENPLVAYRIYMDNRQSLDLYVKHTPQLELDVTGFYTTPQQLSQGYGCDVLWAGKSIAAGSFRGYRNGEIQTIDTVASRTQTVLSPSAVEVINKDWIYNAHPVQMRQTYAVSPESRDLWVEIELDGYLPDDLFCTGIQKLETDNQGFIESAGKAASWGRNIPDKSHPAMVETVGLGIIVDSSNVVDVKEDELNYLVFVKPDADGKIRYRVISCGTREKNGYKNHTDWFSYIKGLK